MRGARVHRGDRAVIDWLLDGDPAIRWQVHQDLLGSSRRTVAAERARVAREGWGRRLLDLQAADGRWSADRRERFRGLYIPKWTSTTYTMLLLARLGPPRWDPGAQRGCQALVEGAEWFPSGGLGFFGSRRVAEHCVSAMVLFVLEAFDADPDARARLSRFLLEEQLGDGGWNCSIGSNHGSFNTTTAALEALLSGANVPRTRKAVERGREFLLEHRLYCSHRTGRVVKPTFTKLRWPVGWETDVLRQLDWFARAEMPRDERLNDAIDLIVRRRLSDGRWAATRPQPGALHFPLEQPGKPSRWVTLKCLHVLKWWRQP